MHGVFLIQQTKASSSFEVKMARTVLNIALFNFPTVNSWFCKIISPQTASVPQIYILKYFYIEEINTLYSEMF